MHTHSNVKKLRKLRYTVKEVSPEYDPPTKELIRHVCVYINTYMCIYIYIYIIIFSKNTIGFYLRGFWIFPGVLEGLGSSGRLVGSISTYPGTSPTMWSQVMTKNLGGGGFLDRPRYLQPFLFIFNMHTHSNAKKLRKR